jgi:glutamate carboxypeptidase
MFEISNLDRYLAITLNTNISQYIHSLHSLCAIKSSTFHKSGIDEMTAWIRDWVKPRGWEVRTRLDQDTGESLVITIRGGKPDGLRVLLATHLDTMSAATALVQPGLHRDGDHLIGPGIATNKSGLLSGLYAMQTLEDLNLLGLFACISLVCGNDKEDEEHGMKSSTALLHTLAPDYNVAFVLEAGRENGDIIGYRRGCGKFIVENHGQTHNANATFLSGDSPATSLLKQIIALQQLDGMRGGISVNTSVIQENLSPLHKSDCAHAEITTWVDSREEQEIITDAITHIISDPLISGTQTSLKIDWRFAPLEATRENKALATLAKTCAHELNLPVTVSHMRGLSYANILASLNLPVLDGLGPSGGHLHTPREYIHMSSIMPRIALLTLLMTRRAEQM